jgi:hypothetical protein
MRLSGPFVRVVLFATCLLVAAPVAAQEGLLFGSAGGETDELPTGLAKLELLSLGVSEPFFLNAQVLRFTCSVRGFRAGASLAEGHGFLGGGGALLPVHVGYTLFSRPHQMLFFQNMLPEVYAEASAAFWQTSMVPFVRGSVYAGVEGFGLGAGLEAGMMSLGWDPNIDPHVRNKPITRRTSLYVALRVKLLAVTVGF